MWSNEEIISLIAAVELQVMKTIPITSTNNNNEFTGNLLDIVNDWNKIADKVNRTGEWVVIQWCGGYLIKYFVRILVGHCQNQWRELIRHFLFITERVNPDEPNSYHNNIVYAINWIHMERMMFLSPYASKYKR